MEPVEYVLSVVRPLLSTPDSLKVVQTHDELGTLLTLSVAKNDMGLIVGKNGENAKAIRQLVRTLGILARKRISIKINEPDGSTYQRRTLESYERGY